MDMDTIETETAATFEILRTAQIRADLAAAAGVAMASSAILCARDAEIRFNANDLRGCRERAIGSLRYSVGVFGADYQRALAAHAEVRS